MSSFKIGDKVRYNEANKRYAKYNQHDANTVYTVRDITPVGEVWFVGSECFCIAYRLELAPEQEETFDYKQALKILAENPEIEVQYQTAHYPNYWGNTVKGDSLILNRGDTFRIKPVIKPTFHWLIKSKGKFSVTQGKYATEEDVKAGYSYPAKVIQKLED